MGFAGQYRMHSENQLIYLRARTYDPVTAQFLTPDPLAAVSGETYAYAAANPVNAIDPLGLIPIDGCGDDPPPYCPECPDERQPTDATAVDTSQRTRTDRPLDWFNIQEYGKERTKDFAQEVVQAYATKGNISGKGLGISAAADLAVQYLKGKGQEGWATVVDLGSKIYALREPLKTFGSMTLNFIRTSAPTVGRTVIQNGGTWVRSIPQP